jgi:hypothetical protein
VNCELIARSSCTTFDELRADCRFFFPTPLQKLKTRVIKKSTNPEWDEELTLSIEDPAVPIRLVRYALDHLHFVSLFFRPA